jgi:hypothetical protein
MATSPQEIRVTAYGDFGYCLMMPARHTNFITTPPDVCLSGVRISTRERLAVPSSLPSLFLRLPEAIGGRRDGGDQSHTAEHNIRRLGFVSVNLMVGSISHHILPFSQKATSLLRGKGGRVVQGGLT